MRRHGGWGRKSTMCVTVAPTLRRFAKKFRQLLREGQYDAVHDHQDYASGWHFLMGAGVLPPVRVTHVHNPAYQILNNYGVTLGRRLTARVGKNTGGTLLDAHHRHFTTGHHRIRLRCVNLLSNPKSGALLRIRPRTLPRGYRRREGFHLPGVRLA